MRRAALIALMGTLLVQGCSDDGGDGGGAGGELSGKDCVFVDEGFGAEGETELEVDEVVSGLDVPWSIAFISENRFLVTERPGRIRIVNDGRLAADPVATVAVGETGEGGLMGLALHPNFSKNRMFYIYYTTPAGRNRLERWHLKSDFLAATLDGVVLDGIAASPRHNGGRIRFGPDGMLYVGTGDAGSPSRSQNREDPAGKILRIAPDGSIPVSNPFRNSPVFLLGIRNTQGFDWLNDDTLIVSDHGPSGELGRTGGDEVSVGTAGANLGWPDVWRCQRSGGTVRPLIAWQRALPPGGAAIYTGSSIPGWNGDLVIAALGAEHLQRVSLAREGDRLSVERHEVYLRGTYGRLREAIMGPDGHLYVTTSNCDGRGSCGARGDRVLRIRGADSGL